ncbi:MAG: hypothetical protein GX995_02655 [Clostridiales bacterium]|nr:hypothetical protein [Clostridiales bacterium]
MQSLYLKGRKRVRLEDNEEITVDYCLVEEREVRAKPLYGIQIIQYGDSKHAISEYTEPISYSKTYVENILDTLIEHNVLVSTFIETVDSLVV